MIKNKTLLVPIYFLLRYFGLFIAIFLYVYVNPDLILIEFYGIDVAYFVAAIAVSFVILFLQIIRSRILLDDERSNISIKKLVMIYMTSFIYGFLTPGRLGELSRAYMLTSSGISKTRSIYNVIFEKIYDVLFLTILSLIIILLLYNSSSTLLFLFLLVILGGMVLLNINTIFFKIPIAFINKFIDGLDKDSSPNFCVSSHLFILLTGILKFAFAFVVYFLLAKSIGLELMPILIFEAMVFGTLITMIPISFMGIGTREALYLLLFNDLAVTNEQIIVYAGTIFLSTFTLLIFVSIVVFINNALPNMFKLTIMK